MCLNINNVQLTASLSTISSVTFLFATKLKKDFYMIRLRLSKCLERECYCSKVKLGPVSPVVEFCNVLQHCLGQNAKYAKSQKGAIFFAGTKGKSKNRKKERWARFRQKAEKAKMAKMAKMANRACNGHDKSSVKYGPMCYATCEV